MQQGGMEYFHNNQFDITGVMKNNTYELNYLSPLI